MKTLRLVAALAAIAFAAPASATTIELFSSDNGWFGSNGTHNNINTNIITGVSGGRTYRNFQVFDISGLIGTVTSATLTYRAGNGQYLADASETVTLFDVTTPASAFGASYPANSSTGRAIYTDLGTGTVFGSTTVFRPTNGNTMPEVAITLNADGISALMQSIANGAGFFVLGAALTSQDGNDRLWAFSSGGQATRLSIETASIEPPSQVPLPAGGVLLLAGLGAFVLVRRRPLPNA